MKVAFTGSFDPAHEGHLYVVREAQRLGFDVVVIVANNPAKDYQTSLDDRVSAAFKYFNKKNPTTKVVNVVGSDSSNIGELIKKLGCDVIIRGIRDDKDFRYEQAITEYNRRVNGLNTIYIPAPEELIKVSSSAIKGLTACSLKSSS